MIYDFLVHEASLERGLLALHEPFPVSLSIAVDVMKLKNSEVIVSTLFTLSSVYVHRPSLDILSPLHPAVAFLGKSVGSVCAFLALPFLGKARFSANDAKIVFFSKVCFGDIQFTPSLDSPRLPIVLFNDLATMCPAFVTRCGPAPFTNRGRAFSAVLAHTRVKTTLGKFSHSFHQLFAPLVKNCMTLLYHKVVTNG
jgi:hypothetical protein